MLPELPSRQVTLRQWVTLYPRSLVMQADTNCANEYARDSAYERGTSRNALIGTNSASWQEKSWAQRFTGHCEYRVRFNRSRHAQRVTTAQRQPGVLAQLANISCDNRSILAPAIVRTLRSTHATDQEFPA